MIEYVKGDILNHIVLIEKIFRNLNITIKVYE